MSNTIDIYSRQYCDACAKAEALVTASDPASHGVVLTMHDVSDDMSVKVVPLLVIGDTTVQGYNEGQINAALSTLYGSPAPMTPPDPTDPGTTTVPDITQPYQAPPAAVPQDTTQDPGEMDMVGSGAVSPVLITAIAALAGFFIGRHLSKR